MTMCVPFNIQSSAEGILLDGFWWPNQPVTYGVHDGSKVFIRHTTDYQSAKRVYEIHAEAARIAAQVCICKPRRCCACCTNLAEG